MSVNEHPPVLSVIPRRFHSLDSLRASMMFLGIVIHATLPYLPMMGEALPFHDPRAANENYWIILFVIHTFRMPIFFLMAGFFAALLRERRGAWGLLSNRFQRIVLPFAVGWVVVFPLIDGTGVYLRAGGGHVGFWAALNDLFAGRLYANPNPTFLWFLYYLTILYPIALAVNSLIDRLGPHVGLRLHYAFRSSMQSRLRPVIFAIPTAITLWPMALGGFDTPTSFRLEPTILAAYGVFFGFGWVLYAHSDLLPSFSRDAWKLCGMAGLLLPINLTALVAQMGSKQGSPIFHLVGVLTGALIAWFYAFGFTGLFIRYLDRSTPWIRYLTDASYWCYLAHYPVIYWFAALIAPFPIPSPVKLVLVIVLDAISILVVYHFLVRSTFLGEWLNGRRYPFRLPWCETREIPQPVVNSGTSNSTVAQTSRTNA